MTGERRRELWQKKLDAMPDDMVISEYHRRLARRKWNRLKNELAADSNEPRQAASSNQSERLPSIPCGHCGNTFIECFGNDPKWWVGCKSCSKLHGIDHTSGTTRDKAIDAWEAAQRALEPQHQGEPDADLKARLDAIFGA